MRTTNKQFKEQIQGHITEILNNEHTTDLKEQLQNAVNAFEMEFNSPYEMKRTPNKYNRFIEWMKGLPSSINPLFTNYDVNEKLKEWFAACGETYNDKRIEDEFTYYLYLITREFKVLCGKNEIKF